MAQNVCDHRRSIAPVAADSIFLTVKRPRKIAFAGNITIPPKNLAGVLTMEILKIISDIYGIPTTNFRF